MLALGEKRTKKSQGKVSLSNFQNYFLKILSNKIIHEKLGKRACTKLKERISNMNRKVLVVCHLPMA